MVIVGHACGGVDMDIHGTASAVHLVTPRMVSGLGGDFGVPVCVCVTHSATCRCCNVCVYLFVNWLPPC